MTKENEEKTKNKVPKIIVILFIILVLIILIICGAYILHTKNMLPDTIDNCLKPINEKIDKLFKIDNIEKDIDEEKENKQEEKSIYKEIAELDKKYDNEDVEIIDVINPNTIMYELFSEKTRENFAIIRVDDKYGLIDNKQAKVIVEPKYEFIYGDGGNTDKEEYLYGLKDDKKYRIDLQTFEESPYENLYGQGGGSLYYYEPNKKEIYTRGYDYQPYEPAENESKRIKNYGGNVLDICYELSEDESEIQEALKKGQTYYIENNLKVGYYSVKTGKLEIKTEYEKGSLFDNGIATVQKEGKSYFINEENQKVYDIEFEDATNIHNNKAWVKVKGKWKLVEFIPEQRIDK